MNTFNLNLDLDKTSGIIQWVTLRQGDKNGTQLSATIYDHGTPVTGSYTARFSLRHPGTGDTYYRETATYNNGVATVTVDEQYAATVTGITAGYFELLQGSTVIASTADFGVRILASATDGAVPGEVYDSAIEDALAELDEATGHINQMVVDATEEYLNAHPELTTTVEDNSLTDAKLIQQGGILSRVDRLMYRLDNLLTATPAEAESVTVTDAAKTPLAGLALYGKSTQDGTPTPSAPVPIQSVTPNLYQQTLYAAGATHSTAGIAITHNADGTCTVNGTATATAWLWGGGSSTNAAFYVELPAGTYCVCGSHNVVVQNMVNGTVSTIVGSTIGNATFTLTEPTLIKAVPVIPNGTTVVNEIAWVAVYAGTSVFPYVPYDHAGLWAVGGNLNPFFSVAPMAASTGYWSGGAASWTITSTDGWGHYSRTVESQSDTDIAIMPQTIFEVGKTYTLMVEWKNVTLTGTASMYMSAGSGRQMSSSGTVSITAGSGVAYKSMTCLYAANDPQTTRFFHWRTRLADNSSLEGNFRLSIYAGDYAGPYQPYVESVTPIPLDGHTLRSLPNGIRDEVAVDERGHVTLTQRVGETTLGEVSNVTAFTSSENLVRFYVVVSGQSATLSMTASGNSGLCNLGAYEPQSGLGNGLPHFYAYDNRVYAVLPPGTVASSSEAVTWINSHPLTIIYRLATPVTHDLGTIDPTALVGPDMTATGIPTAPLALTYERDLNATLARLEAAIATLA